MSSEKDDRPEVPDDELAHVDDAIIGRAFRGSLIAIGLLLLVALATVWFLREPLEKPEIVQRGQIAAPPALDQSKPDLPVVRFTDITRSAGIGFTHVNGATGEKLLPETMGSGVAFLDHDGDGDQDLLFVNSTHWKSAAGPPPTAALYRNDGDGAFENVSAGSGLDVSQYGQGVAVADYDGDGDVDLFFSNVGPNRLFENVGGRFRDVTASAGVQGAADAWSSSSGFFDHDNDGDLDLFVCNYVQWSPEIDRRLNFTLNGVDRAYGPPKQYGATHSYLYRNDGGGKFTDVSANAGIRATNPATGEPMGKALAVTFADVDGDDLLDVLVANDTVQNFVFRNLGDGEFAEIGAGSGVGFDNMGTATGAMGIDAADFANDGHLGIGIGNFANETTSFYVQQRDAWQFVDVANAVGIGSPSRLRLSFGLFFFDYDLDGRLDLLQANGHLEQEINEIQPSQHYRQPAQLFWNCGGGGKPCFAAVADDASGDLGQPIVGRGAAYADIDADGDLDVALTQAGGAPLLLRNDQTSNHHWLRVKLIGSAANLDAIGASVELRTGETTQRRVVMPTRSYLSQMELPVTFGLGGSTQVDSLTVRWPGGARETVTVDGVDRTIVIRRSTPAG